MTVRLGLILLLALISVSSTSLVIRYVSSVPTLVLAFWRLFTASGMMWGYTAFNHPQDKLSSLQIKRIFIAGLFLGCHFACFFLAVRHTSIANATLFGCMAPVFTVIISIFQKRKFSKMIYIGLAFALLGAAIIQLSEFSLTSDSIFGNSIALLGAFFIAVVFVIAEKIRLDTDNIIYGRLLFLIASIALFGITVMAGESIFNFKLEHIPWFIFLGLVPTILGHNLFNYAVKYVSPTTIASIPLGEPIIASFFGYLLFQEGIPSAAFIGGPFILLGIYMIINFQKTKVFE